MKHKPVVPWIGGKGRLANWILSKFPPHTCYVEAFVGAGALYFAKEESKVEVINDINNDLYDLFQVIQHHPEEFVRQFKWALSSRKMFEWQRELDPSGLTQIHRAARFFYLQKQSFGGKVQGRSFGTATTSKPKLNLFSIEEDISQAHLRLARTYIEHLSWEQVFKKYDRPHTLTYLDPPYWQTEGYGVEFGWEHYELMAKMVRECKGMAIVSINNHPDIVKLFNGLHMETKPIKYTVGGGSGSQATELLIWNDQVERKLKKGCG
ncbi:restriction endonuclease subunit M [Thiomicrospira sp. XS5]|uniref:DNA adenine methylase n=1 Tax=Thiomicrospira sp. XS5 TaxID=1775636 RepID=UPI0007482ED8|nr:DNA adenine methylase [Thiomicrospira sp. XS5]KUJ73940.1 restriction endonuclease subunit M [Thiomicrospira sp. XS5]